MGTTPPRTSSARWLGVFALLSVLFTLWIVANDRIGRGHSRGDHAEERSWLSSPVPTNERTPLDDTASPGAGESLSAIAVEQKDPSSGPGVHGRVLDDGKPVIGALVGVRGASGEWERTETSEDGSFRVPAAPGIALVAASHPDAGFGMRRILVPEDESRECTITLDRGQSLDLVVRDATSGSSVEGAFVTVICAGSPDGINGWNAAHGLSRAALLGITEGSTLGYQRDSFFICKVRPVQTDGRGFARLSCLPPGNYDLFIRHNLYEPLVLRHVTIRAGMPAEVLLQRGGSLRVVGPAGGGSAGLVCELHRAGRDQVSFATRATRLNDRGVAVFLPLAAAAYIVSISQNGSMTYQVRMKESDPRLADNRPSMPISSVLARSVFVRAGEETVVDFRERRGAKVRGRTLSNGKPADGLWAFLLATGDDETHLGTARISEGRFSFDDVLPGAYRVRAVLDGDLIAEQPFSVSDRAAEVDVVIDSTPSRLEGIVRDPRGGVAAGGTIKLFPNRHDWSVNSFASLVQRLVADCVSDESGKYASSMITPGAYYVVCIYRGSAIVSSVNVHPGVVSILDFRFDALKLHTLEVRPVDAQGSPRSAGVDLYAKSAGGALIPVFLHGSAEPTELHRLRIVGGDYRLEVSFAGSSVKRVSSLRLDRDQTVRIRLASPIDVLLQVRRRAQPVPNLSLRILDEHGHDCAARVVGWQLVDAQTDGAGTLLLTGISPGRYRLISKLGESSFEIRSGDADDRVVVALEEQDGASESK